MLLVLFFEKSFKNRKKVITFANPIIWDNRIEVLTKNVENSGFIKLQNGLSEQLYRNARVVRDRRGGSGFGSSGFAGR